MRTKENKLACRGWSCCIGLLLAPAFAEAATHRLQLLHLVGSEDRGELVVGVLEDGAGLLAALILSEAGVVVEGGHLLLLIGEDRLELCGLIGGEIEALAEVLRGLLRIHLVMTVVARLASGLFGGRVAGGLVGLLGRLLSEGRGGGEGDCQGGV